MESKFVYMHENQCAPTTLLSTQNYTNEIKQSIFLSCQFKLKPSCQTRADDILIAEHNCGQNSIFPYDSRAQTVDED